ncbi:MAG TPA: OmpA family protein [Kofleriaceae bacterium]|mgnify:CR=1 FL=1|nr:OmpA family protein [Kofleriaceae bacterium]
MIAFVARVALVLAALGLCSACPGRDVRRHVEATQTRIATARDHGALRCAPALLAMAESHADFARQELSEGNYFEAKRQAAIARQNADAALAQSPKERCVPAAPVSPPRIGDLDGDGLLDDVDQCKTEPEDKDGFQDEDGCPDLDDDQDGILDAKDQCRLEPEDKDGFQDEDGCPEADNDGDGLLDAADKCPDVAEDKDGFEDEDGCPDCDDDHDGVLECPQAQDKCPGQHGEPGDGCPKKYDLVVVTESKIELKQTVFFDTRKAKIKPVSFALLNDVALALGDHPTLQVRIEGHTDSQGSDRSNLGLSQRRAEAVRVYLIGKGIDQGRMVAKGYGERAPIADNRTSDGRGQNRRVEFVITSR